MIDDIIPRLSLFGGRTLHERVHEFHFRGQHIFSEEVCLAFKLVVQNKLPEKNGAGGRGKKTNLGKRSPRTCRTILIKSTLYILLFTFSTKMRHACCSHLSGSATVNTE
eukprot:GHVL01018210.1.p1 GENE.GHVL01018210.1~~GHVL01018210.1.p1  ORF type:complete len:109 (+),score=7.52 GHVL01018210.1:159-485(+)